MQQAQIRSGIRAQILLFQQAVQIVTNVLEGVLCFLHPALQYNYTI